MHAVQRLQVARRSRGALARSSSAASGFFFCGMIDEPDAHVVATPRQKPNSSEDHSTISAPSRDRCVAQVAAALRKSSTKSRLETASIEFGTTPAKPSSDATSRRSVGKFTPASAPAPSGSSVVEPSTASKRSRVAPEHPEVGEQVVR